MKHPDTQFLRALAILLVLNSHLDKYYPIPYIGTGGAIGNSIFFFLSAFGLCLSYQKQSKHFKEWFSNRISRIYPSLWIVLIFLYMPVLFWNGKLSYNTITNFVGYFFNPPFWFLQALLIYYLLSYHLLKVTSKTKTLIAFSILIIIYICCYLYKVDLSRWSVEETPFDRIHYFMVFIFGIYIAKNNRSIVYSGTKDYILLLLIIGLIYAQKFLMTKGLTFEYQFLQQTAMYPLLYFLLKISRSPLVIEKLTHSSVFSNPIDFLANNTLEIYMVHETISGSVLSFRMPFPVNIIVFLFLTSSLSAIVNKIANSIRKNIL